MDDVKVEYISLGAKKIRPFFLSIYNFFFNSYWNFKVYNSIYNWINNSINFKKAYKAIIKKFNIDGNLASSICILFFYVITVTLLGFSIVYLCSEIKDLATDGYQYL